MHLRWKPWTALLLGAATLAALVPLSGPAGQEADGLPPPGPGYRPPSSPSQPPEAPTPSPDPGSVDLHTPAVASRGALHAALFAQFQAKVGIPTAGRSAQHHDGAEGGQFGLRVSSCGP